MPSFKSKWYFPKQFQIYDLQYTVFFKSAGPVDLEVIN